jgi:riboflavin synthase
MFTGIVEGIGSIDSIISLEKGLELTMTYLNPSDLKIGDSIAVNGVCLTVVHFHPQDFTVQLVQETLNKTNLGELKVGNRVNIENAAKIGDVVGGHLVQGHVDTTGIITSMKQDGIAKWLRIEFDEAWKRMLAPKGFIAIDGVSLTVVEAGNNFLTVTLIPHTQGKTIVQYYQLGQRVNLEFDIIGKQIQHYMSFYDTK